MIHLKDYRAPDYRIPRAELEFEIFETSVRVSSALIIEREAGTGPDAPLVLNGVKLKLLSISIDDAPLAPEAYTLTETTLTLTRVPDRFTLRSVVEIDPFHNSELEGLYKSGNILCTQNESEGFRRITYFLDRPDVMSAFSATITADKKAYPYLLSNGNLLGQETLPGNRHRVQWEDPFLKPCYLFALVAGDFFRSEDTFTTASGRKVDLHVYVDHGNESKVAHTMASLKRAMRWDEEVFGLEYDLDLFMIVAVDAFNFGAMENKGLNIFNSACALANPDSATDADYQNIEAIVAHEYFHNWTGDRITLRDWFQLTLKEGLTVYRDERYTADTYSRALQRIECVSALRSAQFAEDAGPNAHPIQPESYAEINNFYTNTVYDKGAAVIRMLEVLFGQDGFRRGMDHYVEQFDGRAITTEDFLSAMEEANGVMLTQFRRWYHQAGTPVCEVVGAHDSAAGTFTLSVRQHCEPTADGSPKEPFYFPLTLALLDASGQDMALRLEGDASGTEPATSRTLVIDRAEQAFVFAGISSPPVPSLFRDFSAPVKVKYAYSREDLVFLFHHDSDAFNRYDAGQRLAMDCLLAMTRALRADQDPVVPEAVLEAYGALLDDTAEDLAFSAVAFTLPSVAVINQELAEFDFENTHRAREAFKTALAKRHAAALTACYERCAAEHYQLDGPSAARRRLRNLALDHLSYLPHGAVELAARQFHDADNMTDRMAALSVLCTAATPERDAALAAFLDRYRSDFNVVNKWFAVQASAVRCGGLVNTAKTLATHPLFDAGNPNRIRSVYGAFAGALPAFHEASGAGYRMIADVILTTDPQNSKVAAGLGKHFKHFGHLPAAHKASMRAELERIVATPGLSEGLREVISKTLLHA